MIALPLCRWRKEHLKGHYVCHSVKFCNAPNRVSAAFCAKCRYADHEPPPSAPQTMPCVHLGAPLSGGVQASRGNVESRLGLLACALHGRCTIEAADQCLSTVDRSCATCSDYLPRDPFGPNSAQMLSEAEAFLAAVPPYPKKRYRGRGIVIAGGGDRFFPSLYITIRALRHVGCHLPIQVWYLGRKHEMPAKRKALLIPFDVECVDADQVRRTHPARRLDGWELKAFALLHSPFEDVLYLDADCYPCRDPEFLFDRDDYRTRGAIFWPDAVAVDPRLMWSAFGVPDPRRLGSVESGQMVVNKKLCWQPLNLAWFYNDHSDYYYLYGFGDKHTFEVAWVRCARPYVMWQMQAQWVDVAYLHVGPERRPLFVHRCADKFRLENHPYTTRQHHPLPSFYASLPLERECWGWLSELARLTGRPLIKESTTAQLRRSSESRPDQAGSEHVFDITPYLYDSDPWLLTESLDNVRQCYDWKFRLAQWLRPRRILEIGVRFGYAAAAFLAGAPGAEYFGVDADNGTNGGTFGAYQVARAMLAKKFPDSLIKIARLDTQKDSPEGLNYDLVHVDADHSYEGCLSDLHLAARLGNRWILVDDVRHRSFPGVAEAVHDFVAEAALPHVYFNDSFRGDCLIQLNERLFARKTKPRWG